MSPAHGETITPDGVRIDYHVYAQPGRQSVVVVGHGFFQSKETAAFRQINRALAKHHDVVALDFRGHGRSGGLYTFSARESDDLRAVLSQVRPRYQRIGLMGFSLGGAIAINLLGEGDDGVRSLVAVSAPSAFEEIEFKFWTPEAVRTGLRAMGPGAGCRPGSPLLPKARPVESVQRLVGLPKLFIHGTRDVIVGVEHGRRLYAAAPEPKRLEIIEGGSHAEQLFRDAPDRLSGLVSKWFDETLAPA